MTTKTVDLFTTEEHVIIADWLGVEPKCEVPDLPNAWEVLETLGFEGQASGYSEDDAAVAGIVLERIQGTLPQWASVKLRESEDEEAVITLAREVKARRARRTVELVPRYLLTINWADSGPGFSWPVAYHVTWVPIYDEYTGLGMEGCSSHSGRRTFVTKAAHKIVEAGGSLRDVQQLAGHTSLATTQRYIEGSNDAKRKVVQMI